MPNHLIQRAARRLTRQSRLQPRLAIILGSGFQTVLDEVEEEARIPFADLPGFPAAQVPGHAGCVTAGQLEGVPVWLICGRPHFYQGYSMAEVTFPVRLLAQMGVRALLLTNAAGGINPRFQAGDFMRLTDHINFMGLNPLRPETAASRSDFVDCTQIYDPNLGRLLQAAARQAKARLHSGVYLAVSGPSYETPAEIRAFARLGADAVGMSTVPEAIVARQLGLKVAGLSCITNKAARRGGPPLSHHEVLRTAQRVERAARSLFREFVRQWASSEKKC